MTSPAVVTVSEAAHLVGRSPAFVRLLIADNQVVARKYRGRWYINAASLQEWVGMGAPEPVKPDAGHLVRVWRPSDWPIIVATLNGDTE